jgi:hypothetical protein
MYRHLILWGRGAMKVLADGQRKAVDCGEVVGGNQTGSSHSNQ